MDKEKTGQLEDQTPDEPEYGIDDNGNLKIGDVVLDATGTPVREVEPTATPDEEEKEPEPEQETDDTAQEAEPEPKQDVEEAPKPSKDEDKSDETPAEADPELTPDSLKETDFDKLSRDQLPEKLRPFYDSMRASVGKKWESIAALRKQLEQQVQQAKQQQPQQQPQQPQNQQNPQQLSREEQAKLLTREVMSRTCNMLGIEPRDFDPLNPTHQSFQQMATLQLHQEYQEYQKQQQQQVEMEQKVKEETAQFQNMVEEFRASEPNFEAINAWLPEWLDSLPAKRYREVTEAFKQGDFQNIKRSMNELRKAWYEKNKPPEPVRREPPASPEVKAPEKKLKPSDFGKLSPKEQEEFLISGGFVEG